MTHAIPANGFEQYRVAQGGKRYIIEFVSGQPREVKVRTQRTRYGYRYQTLWYGRVAAEVAAITGRAAEVIAYVLDPAKAAANHATVVDPETARRQNVERATKLQAEIARDERIAAEKQRLADAAPALLDALQVFLLCPETRALLDQHDPMAVRQALEAVAQAAGEAA